MGYKMQEDLGTAAKAIQSLMTSLAKLNYQFDLLYLTSECGHQSSQATIKRKDRAKTWCEFSCSELFVLFEPWCRGPYKKHIEAWAFLEAPCVQSAATKPGSFANTQTHTHNTTHIVSYLDLNGHKLAHYVLLGLELRFSPNSLFSSTKHGRHLPIKSLTFFKASCLDLERTFSVEEKENESE